MSTEEQTCRICRGEATPDDPLFYPCKCRGSIKYIHQGCLEEWLKHSGREPSCDICHQKYKFTTQYKENTPDRVPLRLILLKLRNSTVHLFRYGLTIAALVFGVGIQIPLFWKVSSRFLTWIIDGAMPHENLLVSLIYGESRVEGDPFDMLNVWKALTTAYFDSVTFIIVWVLVHLILFLEHEWVSRDAGFKTLILKKVGPPDTLRPLAGVNRNRAGGQGQPEFNERMIRDVQNLERLLQQRDNPQNEVIQDALRIIQERQRALQREHQNQLRQRNNNQELIDEEDEEHDPDFIPTDSSDNESERNVNFEDEDGDLLRRLEDDRAAMRARVENQVNERFNDNNQVQRPMIPFPFAANQPAVDRIAAGNQNRNGDHPIDAGRLDLNNPRHQEFLDAMIFMPPHLRDQNERRVWEEVVGPDEEFPFANDQPDLPNANVEVPIAINLQNGNGGANANIDPAAAAAAAAAVNAIPVEQDDLLLSLPVYMIIVGGDAFLGVYLFLAYFLPSGIGSLAFISAGFVFKTCLQFLNTILTYTRLNNYADKIVGAIWEAKHYNQHISQTLDNYLIFPIVKTLTNVYEHNLPQSTIERIIPLMVFYGALYSGILSFLSYKSRKHSVQNPLLGLQRKIFIVLLDFVSTLKVFFIFAIELVLFPVYCGFLLEIVGSPVFSYNHPLILSALFLVKDHISLRIATYWATGTIYMCLFALFVGMTRRYILRPGVLFFIRSPEDPNARLIHDALVRPLGLQLSRIGLSGFVYSIFILIGFGAVTYTLKLTDSPILPLQFQSTFAVLLANATAYRVRENMDLIKKYVRQYWIRAFKISSAKLRLSSFIMGKHDPRERGYVVYRNIICQQQNQKPDYTEPRSLKEVKELFKKTDIKAVFIPDGDLVRAPKNDTVSRKFVRKLFIPVSKDDKPLGSNRESIAKLDEKYPLDEFDDSEDELTTTNQYEIVYRPPHFKERTILFIAMLWIFAALLICGVGIISNLLGKPISFILFKLIESLQQNTAFKSSLFDNTVEFNWLNLETSSILNGIQIVVTLLKLYDDYIQRRHIQIEEEEDTAAAAAPVAVADGDTPSPTRRAAGIQREQPFISVIRDVSKFLFGNLKIVFTTAFFFINVFTWLYLGISAHVNAIEIPYRYYSGNDDIEVINGPMVFSLDRYTFPLHVVLLFFTIFPFQERFRSDIRDAFRNGPIEVIDFKSVLKNYTKPILTRLLSVELIVGLTKLGLSIYEYRENSVHYTSFKAVLIYIFVQNAIFKDILIYSWSAVVGSNLVLRGLVKSWKLFNQFNQQIKEEFYVSGKTLENSNAVGEEPVN